MNSTPDMRGIRKSEIITLGSVLPELPQCVDSVLGLACFETRFLQFVRARSSPQGSIVVHEQNTIRSNLAHNILLDILWATILPASVLYTKGDFLSV